MNATHISIPLGIFIGLLASFVQSLGLTIQRKSHVLNQLLPEQHQRVEHRRPLWLLGFFIFISSNILGSLVQIASLPVVILAPLGAVSLLWNAFFARLILGDLFSPWMILGTILIAGGAVLVAVFGIVPEPTRSLEDLLELFKRPTFVAYFSILGAAVFICLVITHIIDYSFTGKLSRFSLPTTPVSNTTILPSKSPVLTPGSTTPATNTGVLTERTPLLDPPLTHLVSSPIHKISHDPELHAINRTRLLLAISYASFSGIISGMCLLFAKSGVELLLLTWRGQNQFWRWQAWVLVFGLAAFALLQLWYLHKALVLADPTLVCPSAFCFYNLSSIVNGLVYFNQFSLISAWHLGLVVLGIIVLLGGVWVVSIKSGGSELDTGSWNEDPELVEDNEDQFMDSSSHSSETEVTGDQAPQIKGSKELNPTFDTEAESNVHLLSTYPNLNGFRGEMEDRTFLRSRPTASQTVPQLPSTRHEPLTPGLAQPISPTHPRPYRHQPTPDISHRFRHGQAQTTSFNHPHPHVPPPVIPLHPVSTLGAGFQIGLSPVSPGFAIAPRERGRKLSGLGLGVGPGFSDIVIDISSSDRREAQRRRTVSEGDVHRRILGLGSDRYTAPEWGSTIDTREEGVAVTQTATRKGKEREGGRERWRWLRDVFTGKV
ncbi:hypothetical protein BDZ94DRAFT_1291385 [Collybia nuda]|uniref:Magnesium transporter n=1 Tax=Collybia nuda TaxID=64659 RepID=A0A9P5Y0A3_9AGAR|nr:hypothetical protein BDZ94DRAFT_1291385 [Collybia nuda]